jgi:hypothetical protein
VVPPPRRLGAVLAEQHGEWAEGRRYLGLDVLARSRITGMPYQSRGMWIKNLTTGRMAFRNDHGGRLVSKAASPRSLGLASG